MRKQRWADAFAFLTAALLAVARPMPAATTNDSWSIQRLAGRYAPGCRVEMDATGKPLAIVSAGGESLELGAAAREHPQPVKGVVGYWYSPSMDFLSRQQMQAANPEQAMGTIQLLHAIGHGLGFVQQKLYTARRFDGGWVVEVRHDFTNYPSSVRAILPYELLVDGGHTVVQLRQRCYDYPGSAGVYTNTVISVYAREIQRNRGRDYPEVLREELRRAWAKERKTMKPAPSGTTE